MRRIRRFGLGCCLLLVMVLSYTTADAGTITGVGGVFGPGLGYVQGLLLYSKLPNNDNSLNATTENGVGFDEIVFDQAAPIDIVLDVSNSGGTSEYSALESLYNFTPDTWLGYEIELGFGTGSDFRPAQRGVGLDFDAPDHDRAPISILFSSVTVTESLLIFEDGEAPFGWVDAVFFDIDVPDGISQFTLRHTPILTRSLVTIDIDPRSEANEIWLDQSRVTVAVLTTSTAAGDAIDFDAVEVAPRSLRFGPTRAEPSRRTRKLDVDQDGDLDLLASFRTRSTGIACGDTEVTLIGETLAGDPIEGTDSILTVGCP